MTRVLIVDDDPLIRLALPQGLRRLDADIDVSVAASSDEALGRLSSPGVDVLVTDLRLDAEEDGIALLTRARTTSPRTRTILMSAFASARDYETAIELGAVSVLCKPFTIPELHAALRRAAESAGGFHGSFHGMSLVDLLQMFHLARRDTTIQLGGQEPGRIDMVRGDIVHAERGGVVGEPAFRALMASASGSFRTTALASGGERTIERSFDGLLLDTLRSIDETDRDERRKRRSEMSLSQLPAEDFFGIAQTAEIPRPSAVPRDPYVPVTPAALAHARAAWTSAREAMGSLAADVVAIAFDLEGSAYEELVIDRAPDELSRELFAIAGSLRRLAGEDEIVACCIGDGFGIGIVSSPSRGYVIGLLDALSSSSSSMLFRSVVATTARCVLEEP